MLNSYDLANHINGSLSPPSQTLTDGQPNSAYLNWFRQDQLVLSWIIGSISEAFIPQVVGATTAHAAWERLAHSYAAGSKSQARTIKSRFFRISQEPDEPIAKYAQRAKTMFDHLGALNTPVTDSDLVQVILNGLGSSYRPFI